MSYVVRPTYYFERPGPVNTEKTIELAIERALELGVGHLVVPSLTGSSALMTAEKARGSGLKVVCVSFRAGGGFSTEPARIDPSRPWIRHWMDIPELAKLREEWRKACYKRVPFLSERRDLVEKLRSMGVRLVIATDLGAGIYTSMAVHLGVKPPLVVMKETLYFFCPGLKVAVFSAVTAADAGAVPVDGELSRGWTRP